jgi:hypothetical protein
MTAKRVNVRSGVRKVRQQEVDRLTTRLILAGIMLVLLPWPVPTIDDLIVPRQERLDRLSLGDPNPRGR